VSEQLPNATDPPAVVNEVLSGDALTLSAASRIMVGHRGGGHSDPATVFRHITRGCKGSNGQRVYLEACRCGSKWVTSRAALARFIVSLTGSPPPSPPGASLSPSARQRRSEKAAAKLKALGA
jgi:hypothetical protein